MTPNELATRIETIVAQAEERFKGVITKTQRRVYNSMVALLKDLELDPDGYIKNNSANRKLLQKSGEAFNSAVKRSNYLGGVSAYAGTMTALSAENAAYFETLSSAFSPNKQFIKSLQKQTIESLENTLLNEGLSANVKQPLLNILNQNVNGGGSFSGMLDQVKGFIQGIDREGALQRYARTWTSDALFTFNRSYQMAVSSDLGLEWYYYGSGLTKDSREFCIERTDMYWQQTDVEGWALLSWGGKNPNTTESSIFFYCGGYNCRHSLIPVSEAGVPDMNKDALALMKKARAVGGELDNEARRIARKYGAKVTPINYKSYGSIIRKAKDDLKGDVSKVMDAVRTTIIPKGTDLVKAAQDVQNSSMTQRLKVQDYGSTTGYRGYLGNVKLSNGTIGEIQVNTAEMIYAKEKPSIAKAVIGEERWNAISKKTGQPGGLGHEYYEQSRKIKIDLDKDSRIVQNEKKALQDSIEKKSREYYSKFYYSYPEKWP